MTTETSSGCVAGGTATSVGDFTGNPATINPTLIGNGYPQTWTQFTVSFPTSGTGRLALRYFVTDGGASGTELRAIRNPAHLDDIIGHTELLEQRVTMDTALDSLDLGPLLAQPDCPLRLELLSSIDSLFVEPF